MESSQAISAHNAWGHSILLDASNDCIIVMDVRARLLWINRRAREMFVTHDVETIDANDFRAFWNGADAENASAALEEALSGRIGRFTGYQAVGSSSRFWDVVVTPVYDGVAPVQQMLAVCRDLTESRLARRILAEGDEHRRLLNAALPGIAWTATPAGEIDILGEGNDLFAAIHADDVGDAQAAWHEALQTRVRFDGQYRFRLGTDQYRWHLVRALPQYHTSGSLTRWIGVLIDIDEQHRADEARQMFVNVIENSTDFIGIGDTAGNTVYINEAGRRLLEIDDHSDVQAKHLSDYLMEQDRGRLRSGIFSLLKRRKRWQGEFRLRNFRTNEPIPVWYSLFQLTDKLGNPKGIATISRDLRGRRRLQAGLRALAQTGHIIFGSLDYSETLENIARAISATFATFCVIDVAGADGKLQRVAFAHRNGRMRRVLAQTMGLDIPVGHPIYEALAGKTTLIARIEDDYVTRMKLSAEYAAIVTELRVSSCIVAPVVMPDGSISGVLTCCLDRNDPLGNYGAEDVMFVEELGRRSGAAIANARHYEKQRNMAIALQEASLPRILPSIEGVRLDGEYLPSIKQALIGGDWYNVTVLPDGRIALSVGDVLGHGFAAAIAMTKVSQAMNTAVKIGLPLNAVLDIADQSLREHNPDLYATAVIAVVDPRTGELEFASAGHPGPMVRDRDGGVLEYTSNGMMLGLRSGEDRGITKISLRPHDTVAFYTDGLIEYARDPVKGDAKLRQVLGRLDPVTTVFPARALVDRVLQDQGAGDDIAVLLMTLNGQKSHA